MTGGDRAPSPAVPADLVRELDAWRRADKTARFWLRDDDAVSDTPELRRLLALAADAGTVFALAVIDQYLSHFHADKRRVATTIPARQPAPDELVVQFGNYPPAFESLAIHNPMRRNILDYWKLQWDFDEVESSRCWRSLDRVFVINLDHRPDRFHSIARELTRVGVPSTASSAFRPASTGAHTTPR